MTIIKTPKFALHFLKFRFSESRISSDPPRNYTYIMGMRFLNFSPQTRQKFVRFALSLQNRVQITKTIVGARKYNNTT